MKINAKIITLSSVLVCSALFSSCSSDKKSESSAPVSDSAVSETTAVTSETQIEEISSKKDFGISLDEIKNANDFNNHFNEDVTTYESGQTYYNYDGTQQSYIYTGVQISGDRYCFVNDSSTGDITYGNTETSKIYFKMSVNSFDVPYGIRFADSQMVKNEIDLMNDNHILFSDFEEITDVVTEGDTTTMTTEIPVSEECYNDLMEFYSYIDMTKYSKIKKIYEMDKKTKTLISSYAYGIKNSGEENLFKYTSMTYSANVLKAPEFIAEIESMTDMRTVNIIDENGNTQSYELPKKILFGYTAPNGYMMFTDKDGKEVYSNLDYLEKDVDIYILPVS